MDVTQARTFLAIVETGNFLTASKRLHVTQSTVSARIRALEDLLGKTLFIRTKAGCHLTPAGQQFYRYAQSMVRVWEDARHQVAIPEGFEDTVVVGGQYSLWTRFLMQWVRALRMSSPHIALRCEIGMPQRLMREMAEGVMDIAVIYNPEHRPGLVVEPLLTDELIMVNATPNTPYQDNYVFVDWGENFRNFHASAFPHLHNPGLSLQLGALGINLLIQSGASGYFPRRVVEPHLSSGMLTAVPSTPVYPYPAYAVYQEGFSTPDIMEATLTSLRHVAARAESDGLAPPFWV